MGLLAGFHPWLARIVSDLGLLAASEPALTCWLALVSDPVAVTSALLDGVEPIALAQNRPSRR